MEIDYILKIETTYKKIETERQSNKVLRCNGKLKKDYWFFQLLENTEAAGVSGVNEKALLLLLKGSALRHLGAHLQAHKCLDTVIG